MLVLSVSGDERHLLWDCVGAAAWRQWIPAKWTNLLEGQDRSLGPSWTPLNRLFRRVCRLNIYSSWTSPSPSMTVYANNTLIAPDWSWKTSGTRPYISASLCYQYTTSSLGMPLDMLKKSRLTIRDVVLNGHLKLQLEIYLLADMIYISVKKNLPTW